METVGKPQKVKKVCRHYRKGHCKYREKCKFSHQVEECEDWLKSENSCKNLHCKNRHAVICLFNTINKCRFGKRCRYLHREKNTKDLENYVEMVKLDKLEKELELLKAENISLKEALKDLTEEVRDIKVNVCQLKEKEVEIVEDTCTENKDMEAAKEEIQVFVEDKVVVHVGKMFKMLQKDTKLLMDIQIEDKIEGYKEDQKRREKEVEKMENELEGKLEKQEEIARRIEHMAENNEEQIRELQLENINDENELKRELTKMKETLKTLLHGHYPIGNGR